LLAELKPCYYDSYDFLHLPVIKAKKSFSYMSGRTYPRVNGMKTCEMTGTTCDSIIASVFHYDTRYLLSDICRSEMDGISSSVGYDYSFTGKLTGSYCYYPGSGSSDNIYTYLSYNPRNDMLEKFTWDTGAHTEDHQINYTYDELLRKKTETHPGNGNVISYAYNLRGWLTSISSPYFNEIIHYVDGPGTPCYNGNISTMQWQASPSLWRGYKFRYDDLNRLKDAVYGEGQNITDNAGRYDEHVSAYTQNGSIERLQRSGRLNDGTYGLVDDLSMTYAGNRLTNVSDRAPSVNYENAFDFKKPERLSLGAEYTYNDNGALLSDCNKGIKSIEYSNTGMPTRIEFTNGNLTEYVYSYSGEKLKTIHSTVFTIVEPELLGNGVVIRKGTETKYKSPIDSTLYVSPGLEKTGGRLRFLFDGGYLDYTEVPAHSCLFWIMAFTSRIIWATCVRWLPMTAAACSPRSITPSAASWATSARDPDVQHRKYNGKEYDHIHGLDWYDYGARSYDPALATWTSVDPLAEKYLWMSPYVYCLNNPIKFLDQDGRNPGDFFTNLDLAAKDFGNYSNFKSIKENKEYSTAFYSITKYGKSGYTYVEPIVGTSESSKVPYTEKNEKKMVNGKEVRATAHTHGAYDKELEIGNDVFSGITKDGNFLEGDEARKAVTDKTKDIGSSNVSKLSDYLVTPNGSLQYYDHSTGKVRLVSRDMPKDGNDPNKIDDAMKLYK
jgi:RHS repeat-associated protein